MPDLAERAIRFINLLTLSDDYVGLSLTLRPWQEHILRRLYSVNQDGGRTYRRCLLMLPRKQAKTQLVTSIGVYEIVGSGKTGQTVLCAASDKEQASHIFNKACDIINASPFLTRRCKIYASKKTIEVPMYHNTLKVISAEGRRQHAHNPSLVLFDELHTQPNRELWDALSSAFGARKSPMLIAISTQSNDRHSLMYTEYEYACRVRDGEVTDPTYLPIIYEAGDDDDWTDESTWHKCMPALGDFCNLEFIREEFRRAKEIPSEESKFRQYYLNQLVASATRFINLDHWSECGKFPVLAEELKGKPCFGGLDLASVSDATAFVLVFPKDDGTYKSLCWFWLPKEYGKKRQEKDGIPYLRWAQKSHNNLILTPGDIVDYDLIEAKILELSKTYQIKHINVDPYNAMQVVPKLMGKGLPVQFMRQGPLSFNAPLKWMSVLIAKHQLHHGNNDVLTWMAENAVTVSDRHDNICLDKDKSRDKIDGIISLGMGLAGAMAAKPIGDPSVAWI